MPLPPRALLCSLLVLGGAAGLRAQAPADARVILITFDGIRAEDFFGGLDTIVSAREEDSGIYDLERLRRDYWRDTPEARRRAVMPFFWDSLAPRGMVLGDAARGSTVRITNPHGFSAPGYQELLTGHAQPDVTSNDQRRYPHRTVLEHVRATLRLAPERVAAFTSWENFRFYVASQEGAVFVNAGYDSIPADRQTPIMARLLGVQPRALALWEGSRLDAFTGALALEWLRRHDPRVMYLAFNDTDDLAHNRRYDRVLDALHALDDFLRELWQTVESLPAYRGRTTIILTTDHGRGHTPRDWTDHGEDVPGSETIWLAVIGPRTPDRGVVAGVAATQANIAATLLECLGLPGAGWSAETAPPVAGACVR